MLSQTSTQTTRLADLERLASDPEAGKWQLYHAYRLARRRSCQSRLSLPTRIKYRAIEDALFAAFKAEVRA